MPSSASASSRPSTPTTPITSHQHASHPAYALLAKAHPPETAAQIFTDKLKSKPLLLNPGSSNDKRALRRHIRQRKKAYFLRKQKPQPLSAKEKRANGGIYALPLGKNKKSGNKVSYEIYQQLNRLWNGYMLEILGLNDPKPTSLSSSRVTARINIHSQGSLLASADFHGADLQVVRCNDVGKVGLRGIVVRDTKFTFVLVTPANQVRMVMKKGAVFRYFVTLPTVNNGGEEVSEMDIDDGKMDIETEDSEEGKKLVFELHGNQFEYRPAERANRKFKWRVMDYL